MQFGHEIDRQPRTAFCGLVRRFRKKLLFENATSFQIRVPSKENYLIHRNINREASTISL